MRGKSRRKELKEGVQDEGKRTWREMEEEERKSESHCNLIGVKKRGGLETGNQLLGLRFVLVWLCLQLDLTLKCVNGRKHYAGIKTEA